MSGLRLRLATLSLGLSLAGPATAMPPAIISPPLADTWEWDWEGFKKFWRTQFGKTTGVVGAAGVVVGIGVLIICSAKKKT